MAIPIVRIEGDFDALFCPFTGAQVDGGEIVHEEVPTLLFVYYGTASTYAYVAPEVADALRGQGVEVDDPEDVDLEPADLAERLEFPGAFVIEVNAGWNGVNSYAFRPKPA
jgi:hypothetical protein